jgi:hypothetical protein
MYSIPLIKPRIITCFHLKYLKTVITTLLLPKHAHIHDRPKSHIFVALSKCDPSHNKWYKYVIYRNKY